MNRGRPEAAAAVWLQAADRSPDPAPGRPRLRGGIQAAVGATAGALIYAFWSSLVGTIVLCIAGVIGLSALLSPRGLYAAIERVFEALGRLTGRALTWLLMGAIFYGMVTPFGLLFRRGARDPMRRFYEPDRDTYWETRELSRSGSGSHVRQF